MDDTQFFPKLSDSQLSTFDVDATALYCLEQKIFPVLEKKFPKGDFRFLDLGGGNGNFTDMILSRFPNSLGTVLDSSELLLNRNKIHSNKQCLNFDILKLSSLSQTYDVIFCNWVLHHIITRGFFSTRNLQLDVLKQSCNLLNAGGIFIIVEELKNGFNNSDFPNALIFQLTKLKVLSPITKRFGANTAGVGVAFLSEKTFMHQLTSVFSSVEVIHAPKDLPPPLWRTVLTIRSLQNGAIFCCKK